MIMIDNVETMVDLVFVHEPDALMNIYENEELIAIVCKDDWESDRFNRVKAKCRQYRPPRFVEMGEMPFVGKVVRIKMELGRRKDARC